MGRLVASLGRLARRMAALPEEDDTNEATTLIAGNDVTVEGLGGVSGETPKSDAAGMKDVVAAPTESKSTTAESGGGGGKKRKKGRR